MKSDIHEISNELYTQRQRSIQEKKDKERKKKYNNDLKYLLQEEIDNFIRENDNGNIHDIQLQVLDCQDAIIEFVAKRIKDKGIYDAKRIQIELDLKEIFLKEFNKVIKEYKTRCNIEKQLQKDINKKIYEDILERLIYCYDTLNSENKYDMKIILKNMYKDAFIEDTFDYLDLDLNNNNKEIYYKALKELNRRKKETINDIQEKKRIIPLSWKCYGVLKVIDKMLK